MQSGTQTTLLSSTQWQQWEESGYLILKNFFSSQQVERYHDFIEQLWTERHARRNTTPCDIYINTTEEARLPLHRVNDDARQIPHKLNDLYLDYPEVRELSLDKNLNHILAQLLGQAPIAINSLSLELGSEQPNHIDTFYMPPKVSNKMLASWIALDEVGSENGPLRFYPGSHKIPPFRFSHGKLNAIENEISDFYSYINAEIENRQLRSKIFRAEPGDVLIWHAQLLHGGEKILKNKRRRSLVTHYFRVSDQWQRLWRIRRAHTGGYYLKRPHQAYSGVE